MSEWRDIPGYVGHYQASADGKIRSVTRLIGETNRRVEKRVLKHSANPQGRKRVVLCIDGKTKAHAVHRLVYAAFKGEVPENTDVYPKDGDFLNVSIENLALRQSARKTKP
jgi:hypothetical protein